MTGFRQRMELAVRSVSTKDLDALAEALRAAGAPKAEEVREKLLDLLRGVVPDDSHLSQYLVAAEMDGESADLFVTAATPESAVALWQDYYAEADLDEPKLFKVPEKAFVEGVHGWDAVEQVEVARPPRP